MKRLLIATILLTSIALATVVPSLRDRALAAPSTENVDLSSVPAATALGLSSYWHSKILRWSDLIVQEAARRDMDPDFLASLVWMESRGDPQAVGPAGAVGLMQVMPKEAGFSWRPTQEALLDPTTNLFWGTRTLATVVRQGKGDIFHALAAYNGGWEQVTYRGPQRFATTILRDYARAVARRHDLQGGWMAVFAVRESGIRGPIWVTGTDRDDVHGYGDVNVTPEGGPLVPDIAPTSVMASCFDEQVGVPCDVGLWILDGATQQWVAPVDAQPEAAAPPTAQPTSHPPAPSVYVMAGSARPAGWEAAGTIQPTPTATPQPPVAPAETLGAATAATAASVRAIAEAGRPDAVSEETESVVPTSLPSCAAEPLRVDAWPLDRDFIVGTETTPEGWKVRIYAEGHGGDCVYTYAWNDESDIRAANVRGPVTFEVTSTRRDCVILGTVVVISGDSVERVGMYIRPPK